MGHEKRKENNKENHNETQSRSKEEENEALLMNMKYKGCVLDQNPMEHRWDGLR